MRDMNDRDLAHALYVEQKALNRLAEHDALIMNMVVAVRSQVNMVAANLNGPQKNVAEPWAKVGALHQGFGGPPQTL